MHACVTSCMCPRAGNSKLLSPFPPYQHASSDVERLLIGNKCDWEAKRAVESERGEQLARSQGIPFLETSAKTNHNIDEVRGHFVM